MLRTRSTNVYQCCSQVTTGFDEAYGLIVRPTMQRGTPQTLRFFIKTAMKERKQIQCSECNKPSDVKARINVDAAPAILVIIIARFFQGTRGLRPRKSHAIVTFESRLDLSRYYIPNKPVRKHSLRYQLVGVLYHQGSLAAGHYTAAVRQPDENSGLPTRSHENAKRRRSSDAANRPAGGKWKLANDSTITDFSWAEIQQKTAQPGVVTPYMLFYKRY